jgi:hypothetical protein
MSNVTTLSNKLKSSIFLDKFSIFLKPILIGILTLSFALGSLQFTKPKIEIKADSLTPSCGNNAIVTNPTFNYNGESIVIGNNLYVSDSSKISVIDVTTNSIVTTIPLAKSIQKFYNLSGKLYAVTNGNINGETLEIINSVTNTITGTVALSGGFNQMVVGNKIYFANYFTGGMQVFDTVTDTITSNFNVGGQPTIFALVGNKMYINDNDGYYIKVLDTNTNTVVASIYGSGSISSATQVGTKLFLNDESWNAVKVIETSNDTRLTDIAIGTTQRNSTKIGNNVYVLAGFNQTNIYIIDGVNATLTSTNFISNDNTNGGGNIRYINGKLFIDFYYNQAIGVVDQISNTISKYISIPYYPSQSSTTDNKMYVSSGNKVYVLDMTAEQLIQPCPGFGTANTVTGTIGNTFPDIPLTGNTVPNYTQATFTLQNSTTLITGQILNNSFVPNPNQVIPNDVVIGFSTGVLSAANFTSVTLQTNFVVGTLGNGVVNQSISGEVGTQFPFVPLVGATLFYGTPMSFTPPNSNTVIQGAFQYFDGAVGFMPNSGSIIPVDAAVGISTGVLSSPNVPSLNLTTSFSLPFLSTSTIPLNVTINQWVDQVDPTTDNLIKFTAVFSQSIDTNSFDASDIVLTGTASNMSIGSIVEMPPNNGTTFLINVNTSGPGTVIANIPKAEYNYTGNILGTAGTNPNGIKLDSLGNIYTTNYDSNTVTKITPQGVSTVFASTDLGPNDLTIDNQDNIYTINSQNNYGGTIYNNSNSITKITPQGVTSTFNNIGLKPFKIKSDQAGNMYVVDNQAGGVLKVTPQGVVTTFYTGSGITDIAIDSNQNVYIATNYYYYNWKYEVIKVTPQGVSSLYGSVYTNIAQIVVDSVGNVFATVYDNQKVYKFSPQGTASLFYSTYTYSHSPLSMAIDSSDNIYTGNYPNYNITKITPQGVATNIQNPGSHPRSITVDNQGNLYSANYLSNNITKFTKSLLTGIRTSSNQGNELATFTDNSVTINTIYTFGNYTGLLNGVIGTSFPVISLDGSNLPDDTATTLSLSSSTSTIQGVISGGNFVPDSGQIIPSDVVVGNSNGVLSSPGVADLNITTNFSNPIVLPPSAEPYPAACSNRIIDTGQNYSNDFRTDIRVLGGNKLYIAGASVFNPSQREIKVIDVTTNQLVGTIATPSPVQNLFFINGKLYAAMYNPLTYTAERISVIDPSTGLESSSIPISPTRSIKSLGSKIFVATSNSIVTIETTNDTITNTMGGFNNPEIAVATNGKLYVANQSSTLVVDIASSTVVKTLPFYMYRPFQVNNLLYMQGIKVFDTITDTVVANIPINVYQRDIIVKGDKLFLLGDSYSSKLMTIDLNTNTLIATTDIETGNNANEIIYGGGEIMVIKNSTYDAKLFFIDPNNGSITKTIPMDRQLVTYIAVRNRTYLIEALGPVVLDTDIRDYQQPCPTLGTAYEITGYAGLGFPSIYLNRNNAPNDTPATLTLQNSSQTITGKIINNTFQPDLNQTIPADVTFGNSTGTLSATGYTSIIVPTNFSALPVLGSFIGSLTGNVNDYFPSFYLNGSTVPNGTPASLVLPGTTNMMMGTIQNGYFTVSSYQTIPLDVTIGPATAVLSTSITPSINIPTDFGIEVITGSFQSPYPNIINYDDNHDAIVKYEIVFSRNINVSSFTADDITFGFFQGCSVVLISPYYSNISTNRFDVVMNCGQDPLNDGAIVYPQLQAGAVTNGISTNNYFANRGTSVSLKYSPTDLITADVPSLINSNNQTTFAITGSCVSGYDVNIFIALNSQSITTPCNDSSYSIVPGVNLQCYSDYYGSCNYIVTANQNLNPNDDYLQSIGSTDYGILNNQTGGDLYIVPQVNINGTNYLYSNTPSLSYYCSDSQNYTLTTSYGNTFSGLCEINNGNTVDIAANFPSPLPNGPISITGTSIDLFGNTKNINFQGDVCNDPNFVPGYIDQVWWNFGAIKASAQSLPNCIPNCNVTSTNQFYNFFLSPLVANAQSSGACSVTIDVPTLINQNNYQNFNITGNCVAGYDVNIVINGTNENITSVCDVDGTYSVSPQVQIPTPTFICNSNYVDSCPYTATVSQDINGTITSASDSGVLNTLTDNGIGSDYTIELNGITYIYNNQATISYYCQDKQTFVNNLNLSVNCDPAINQGIVNLSDLIGRPLTNGYLTINGTETDEFGNTKQAYYAVQVCNDPNFVPPNAPSGFFDFGMIKAVAATAPPACSGFPYSTTTSSSSNSNSRSSSVSSNDSSQISSLLSSGDQISSISSLTNSLISSILSSASSISSDSCVIIIPLVANCTNNISSSSISNSVSSPYQISSSSTLVSTSSILSSLEQSSSQSISSFYQTVSSTSVDNSSSQIATLYISSTSSNSQSNILSSITSSNSSELDTDGDGVPKVIEDQAPNNGDGNKDGILDSTQSDVASVKAIDSNTIVTIQIQPKVTNSSSTSSISSISTNSSLSTANSDNCKTFSKVSMVKEIENIVQDSQFEYPVGFVNFEANCPSNIEVKIFWYGLDVNKTYVNRKFQSNGNTYEFVEGVQTSVETINNQQVLTYTYTVADNGVLDEDPTIGKIKDPIGPALQISNISGGVITIDNKSSSSNNPVTKQSSSIIINPIIQSIADKITPIDDSQLQSETELANINTVRTGGSRNYNNLFGILLILSGIGMLTYLPKKKAE